MITCAVDVEDCCLKVCISLLCLSIECRDVVRAKLQRKVYVCNSDSPEMYDLKCKRFFFFPPPSTYLARFQFHIVLLKMKFFWNMTFCQLINKGNKGKQYNAEGEVHFEKLCHPCYCVFW